MADVQDDTWSTPVVSRPTPEVFPSGRGRTSKVPCPPPPLLNAPSQFQTWRRLFPPFVLSIFVVFLLWRLVRSYLHPVSWPHSVSRFHVPSVPPLQPTRLSSTGFLRSDEVITGKVMEGLSHSVQVWTKTNQKVPDTSLSLHSLWSVEREDSIIITFKDKILVYDFTYLLWVVKPSLVSHHHFVTDPKRKTKDVSWFQESSETGRKASKKC